jgi:hypothetical protein
LRYWVNSFDGISYKHGHVALLLSVEEFLVHGQSYCTMCMRLIGARGPSCSKREWFYQPWQIIYVTIWVCDLGGLSAERLC